MSGFGSACRESGSSHFSGVPRPLVVHAALRVALWSSMPFVVRLVAEPSCDALDLPYDAVVALGSGVGDAEFEEALDRRPPAFDGGGQAGVGAGGKEPGQAVGGPAAKADPAISAASTLTRVIRR